MDGLVEILFRLGGVALLERYLPETEISGAARWIFFNGLFEFGVSSQLIACGGIGARQRHVRLRSFRGSGGKRGRTQRVGLSLFVLPGLKLDFRKFQAHVEV